MSDEGEAAKLLEAGWGRAARWNTTAGKWLAYSSLTVGGVHFPGWRPWFLRWTWIREAVTFEGKNVLDLGCSVGLFCCFALLEGAQSAIGVDADASALDAAQLIATGLGVRPRFEQLRLGSSDGWQARLPSADIAVAMSIGEWVDDKKAFFTFLSRVSRAHLRRTRLAEDRARSPSGSRLSAHRDPGGQRPRPRALPRHAIGAAQSKRQLTFSGLARSLAARARDSRPGGARPRASRDRLRGGRSGGSRPCR